MRSLEKLHGEFVSTRRVMALAGSLADLLPRRAKVLDVGCGDGRIAKEILQRRPDLEIQGIDVLVRNSCSIEVLQYDGRVIPFSAGAFDLVMLVDVLHHTPDPRALLLESARVARRSLLIKDHLIGGVLDGPILRMMDVVGNQRFGVSLTFRFWTRRRWQQVFDELGLGIGAWHGGRLGLYPFPANLVFENGLHFIARLDKKPWDGTQAR